MKFILLPPALIVYWIVFQVVYDCRYLTLFRIFVEHANPCALLAFSAQPPNTRKMMGLGTSRF
jgi:hypothetical protein